MRDSFRAPLRAAAIAFLVVGTLLFFINPPSLSGAEDLITLLMGAAALVLVTSWATIALMGDDGPSELEFDRIVERSERLAKEPPPAAPPDYFDEIVTEAIDALPAEFRDMLEDAPVVVSHRGHEHRAYGHYFGDTVARDNYPDRIVIYRDTLERDFGHDPELLRAQVERTLRHEVGHHLGWGERGVRELGL
jgi:predicted Zn-dependent protease with MMP-like domain